MNIFEALIWKVLPQWGKIANTAEAAEEKEIDTLLTHIAKLYVKLKRRVMDLEGQVEEIPEPKERLNEPEIHTLKQRMSKIIDLLEANWTGSHWGITLECRPYSDWNRTVAKATMQERTMFFQSHPDTFEKALIELEDQIKKAIAGKENAKRDQGS